MNTPAIKALLPSFIRLIMGGFTALLVSYGMDAGQAGDFTGQLYNIVAGLMVGGGALAWSAGEKNLTKKPYQAGALTDNPNDVNVEPLPVEELIVDARPPKGFFLSDRSLKILDGVDKRLAQIFKIAIIDSPHDFVCYHGLRTQEEQEAMINANKSWVAHSKHQDGLAVDFGVWKDGKIDWDNTDAYKEVAGHIKGVAYDLGTPVVWGGDWKKRDMVHIELV